MHDKLKTIRYVLIRKWESHISATLLWNNYTHFLDLLQQTTDTTVITTEINTMITRMTAAAIGMTTCTTPACTK